MSLQPHFLLRAQASLSEDDHHRAPEHLLGESRTELVIDAVEASDDAFSEFFMNELDIASHAQGGCKADAESDIEELEGGRCARCEFLPRRGG
jgi:hypothetical protein